MDKDEKENDIETEIVDFGRPDFKFVAKNCTWRQQGFYLVCKSCEVQHAQYIGKDKIMVGIDKNGPILKSRSLISG
jgi:hypothetical protein